MLPLVRKDMILHKMAIYSFSPILVIFLGWCASQDMSQNAFITTSCLYCSILPMTLFARDDKFKADAFICSLPVTRKQVVRARYLTAWTLALVAALASFTLYSLFGSEGPDAIWNTSALARVLLTLTAGLGLMTPFLMRFGWTGLIVGLVAAQILGIVALLVVRRFSPQLHLRDAFNAVSDFVDGTQAQLGNPLYLLVVLVVLTLFNFGSCKAAVFLYERREL